jgi:hypothetical protein
MSVILKVPVQQFVSNPTLTSVTPTGGSASTWTYKIVGVDASGGVTAASAGTSTAVGAATLDGSHFNTLAWTDPANAVTIRIYRTVAATSPTSLGLIGSVAAGVQTFVDNGVAGDASTAPAANTTGVGGSVECASLRDKSVQVDGTFSSTNQIQGTIDGVNWQNEGSAATSAAVVNITTSWVFIRNKQTAFTSGTPTITFCGHKEA